MSAIPYGPDREETWEDEPQQPLELPGRPRRRLLNRRSAALLALLACGAGFYGGVRVEKSQLATSSSAARSFSPPTAGGSTTRSSSAATGSGTSGTRSSSPSGFPAGGGIPGAAFGGDASIGTISSVDGKTVYITEASGDVVEVTLSSATKITKSIGVSKRSLHPGDAVVIQGAKNANGTLSATSVSDSGASNTAASGGSTNSSSGSSAVSSLFGSGSGG